MAIFPAIKPTSRSFKPGTYPRKTYRALNGATITRTYGNSPYGAVMELEFDNIVDASVVLIIEHYKAQTASNKRFKLSKDVTAGMSSALVTTANGLDDGLRWEYSSPPDVESVHVGRHRVRVTLNGEIRNPKLDD